jgi:hypothetical protein
MRPLSMVATALLLVTGCFTHRAEPAPMPGPDQVRVRFNPPRSVDVAVAGRDTMRLSDVRQLDGRVVAARGDTLTLALRDVRVSNGSVPGVVSGSSTAVVRLGAGGVAEVRRLDKTRTTLAVLAGAGIGLLALLIAAIASTPVY